MGRTELMMMMIDNSSSSSSGNNKNGQPKLLDTLQGENIAKLLLSQHCRTQQQFYVLTIGFEFEGHQFAGR
ncbi:hypothetical protein T02_7487 [Trichinella nativa]|uniref:Uncharacterized protein n=1 Tax=Trichinella nativa TaxID=6335 RepID=A0A0V1LH79_9BILA|nr:hypothetical protein T02_7487 [Trichinella nativa]